ncbi:MAG: hypothetical protein WCB74_11920 [Pseudolabrys sp.]
MAIDTIERLDRHAEKAGRQLALRSRHGDVQQVALFLHAFSLPGG